ncbi:MAG: ParB N-terminal domain-containing protein, partial [Desulfofustis sp.]
MNRANKVELVIKTVDAETLDSTYSWSPHRDFLIDPDPELAESIDRFGLLRPLVVRENHKGHELICGARRLEALRQCGTMRNIPCYFAGHSASDIEMFRLVVEDQRQSSPLSPIETAYLINLFRRKKLPENTNDLERATKTRSETERHRLISLLELEKPLQRAIHHGSLSVRNGLTMKALARKERIFVFDIFVKLSLNGGKQRRLLELATIISIAQRRSLDEVLARNFPEVCSG